MVARSVVFLGNGLYQPRPQQLPDPHQERRRDLQLMQQHHHAETEQDASAMKDQEMLGETVIQTLTIIPRSCSAYFNLRPTKGPKHRSLFVWTMSSRPINLSLGLRKRFSERDLLSATNSNRGFFRYNMKLHSYRLYGHVEFLILPVFLNNQSRLQLGQEEPLEKHL